MYSIHSVHCDDFNSNCPRTREQAIERLSLKQNFIWNSAGNLIYLLSQWFLTYLTVRIAGYSAAGVLSAAISVGTSLSAISLFNMRSYQVSDVQKRFSDETYLRSRAVTSLLSVAACLVWLQFLGYSAESNIVVLLFLLYKIAESYSDAYQGILQVNYRMDYIGKSFIARGVLSILSYACALFFTGNLIIALSAMLLSAITVVLFYDRRKAMQYALHNNSLCDKFSTSFKPVLSLLIACLPVAYYSLFINMSCQVPRLFLESQYGADQLGIYTSIAMPVTLIQTSANYIITPITTPLAEYAYSGRIGDFIKLLSKAIIAAVFLSIAAVILYALFGEEIYLLLFGEDIVPYVHLGFPLIACGILTAFAWLGGTLLTILRNNTALVIASSLSLVASCVGSILLLNIFELDGATLAQIIAMGVFILVSVLALVKSYSRSL